MKDATLKQAGKLLSIFDEMSSKKLQDLIASGLLADLRDYAHPNAINREEFCRFLNKYSSQTCYRNFVNDKTAEGWRLLEDVSDSIPIKIASLQIISYLKRGEFCISSNNMRLRAVELNANLGQKHAEYILEHRSEIPKELRGHALVFPGTVWSGKEPDPKRYVPCLDWDGVNWELNFIWLDNVSHGGFRLLTHK